MVLRPGVPSLVNKYKPWLFYRFTSLIAGCLIVSFVALDRVRSASALVLAEGEEKKNVRCLLITIPNENVYIE